MRVHCLLVLWHPALGERRATAADFWGTKNAGINYGMLFTAWGVAGLLGAKNWRQLYDKYHNYQMAFYTAAVLALVALLSEFMAKRPKHV